MSPRPARHWPSRATWLSALLDGWGPLAASSTPRRVAHDSGRGVTRPGEARVACRLAADRTSVTPVVGYSSQRIARPWVHKVCRLVILSGRAAEMGAKKGPAGEDRARSRASMVQRCGGSVAGHRLRCRGCDFVEHMSAPLNRDTSDFPTGQRHQRARGRRTRSAWAGNDRWSAATEDGGYAAGHAARRRPCRPVWSS